MRIPIFILAAVVLASCAAETPSPPGNDVAANFAAPSLAGNDSAGSGIGAVDGPLSVYVGKYPFDKVAGVSFLAHPLVRAAVEGAVPDAKIRRWILDKAGPRSPITLYDGRLVSGGCQENFCGPHEWTVLLAPDGTRAEICYKPPGQNTRIWYAGGKDVRRTDLCPSHGG